ncbi:hypothetical protein LSM04_008211 [Trypanosoma melophagium]|uniref:uncharacterized protein n=1 Tax=Trypanosoma melophagium TaxID=715481 RepID=UPI00351A86A0|nr:hypothetical protein LSM04_008211 [Trypanosoma melophagium]
MERTPHNAPSDTVRAFLPASVDGYPKRATGSNVSIRSQLPSVPVLSPLAIATGKKSTDVFNSQPISMRSSVEIPLRNGHQSRLPFHGGNPTPRISPVISSGCRDLRGRRYSSNAFSQTSGDAVALPSVSPNILPVITPAPSVATGSSNSSAILQGAGGGRRIFRRIGMNCVYDMYGDDSVSIEQETPTISDETCGLNNSMMMNPTLIGDGTAGDNNNNNYDKNNNSCTPFVRPWLRQQTLPAVNFLFDGRKETEILQEMPLDDSPNVKNSSGKVRNLKFTGTHRRRHNCPHHRVINEGDLHVAEIPHKDSSHYLRSYSLTASDFALMKEGIHGDKGFNGNRNHSPELKRQPSRQSSTLNISGGNIVIAPTPKSSVTLSRTLSNHRAKSGRGSTCEAFSPPRQSSPSNTKAEINEKNLESDSTSMKRKVTGIIEEVWRDTLSCSSTGSSPKSLRSSISDDGSCCSCCSCFIEGRGANSVDAGKQRKDEFVASTSKPHVVAYNNFFDTEDIPVVSVCSFRRAPSLSKGGGLDMKMSNDEKM